MILIYADAHTQFDELLNTYKIHEDSVEAVYLAGDQCPNEPLEEILADVACPVRFILGNHDPDREHWLKNHFGLWEGHLHCRTHSTAEITVAGLSGVFRGGIWYPGNQVYYFNREQMYYESIARRQLYRGQIPRKHWGSIFYEDLNTLAKLRADILLTHEAPSTHHHGFKEIDELAVLMEASLIVHGHHHQSYQAVTSSGIKVMGVGKQDCLLLDKQMITNLN